MLKAPKGRLDPLAPPDPKAPKARKVTLAPLDLKVLLAQPVAIWLPLLPLAPNTLAQVLVLPATPKSTMSS